MFSHDVAKMIVTDSDSRLHPSNYYVKRFMQ